METLFWTFKARDPFTIAGPLFLSLLIGFIIVQSDFVGLLLGFFGRLAFLGRPDAFVPFGRNRDATESTLLRPTGVVIIPSLLRGADDFSAITVTVESCATNGYPSELFVIASVDGKTEKPHLYADLVTWVSKQQFPSNVHVHVGGTPTRLGKMMAVEAGVQLMKEISARRGIPFPELYFSIDGDGTLSPDSLERLAARLTTPHEITGNRRRVVSGKICIRPDLFWNGWRESIPRLFTVQGQIYMQVAREFLLSNIARYNCKLTRKSGSQAHSTSPGAT